MRIFGFGLGVSFGSVVFPTLTISPSSSTVGASGIGETFTASGGTGTGYTYTMHTNASGGSVNSSTGAYLPGATPGTDVVRVTDSLGHTADGTITVSAALSISPSTVNLMTSPGGQSTQTFTASGGSGTGYVFSFDGVAFGTGDTVDSGTGVYAAFTALDVESGIPNGRVVRVTDSIGNTADAVVSVYPRLTLTDDGFGVLGTPTAVSQFTVTASGGSGAGYGYNVLTTTNSTINAGTGVYQAGDSNGSHADTFLVSDSLGFNASHGPFTVENLDCRNPFPASYGTCVVSYISSRGITLVSTTHVSAWANDLGDASKDTSQATDANRPIQIASDAAYGNQPTVTVNGSQWLASGTWGAAQAQPLTEYVVGQVDSGGFGYLFAAGTVGPSIVSYSAAFWEAVADAYLDSASTPYAPAVVCGTFNGVSSAIYVNNHASGVTGTTGFTYSFPKTGIGARSDGTVPCHGKIAFAAIFSGTHGATERGRLFTAMTNRYGIATT